MNPQMGAGPQAGFQQQMPQQTQNVSQQRQTPGGQQKGPQGQQQPQTLYVNFNPQLALFMLEKGKNDESWIDVKPKEQHVAVEELEDKLTKFRRSKVPVTKALDEIPSANCRAVINHLVEDQNEELWKRNRTLKYTIAAVEISWREIRRQRQLKRVQVILKPEPSGMQDPQMMKPAAGAFGNGNNVQDMNKGMKQNGMGQGQQMNGQPNNMGMHMGQQPKIGQQGQNMGQGQHFEQRPAPPAGGQGQMHGGGAPPPPPPPPGGLGAHGGAPPPPPPPPGGVHLPPHGAHGGMMPGAYPGTAPMHARRGQPPIEVLDSRYMDGKKSKHHKGHRDDSSSESGSSEWESESGSSSGSSSSDPIRVRNVGGGYGLVDSREKHSKHSSRKKHSRKHGKSRSGRSRSVSRHGPSGRDRSRSHSRVRSSMRRRDSDLIDSPLRGRHSANSSGHSSPKLPPINIFMPGNNSSEDERPHRHGKSHRRHHSGSRSPTKQYNKQKLDRMNMSHPMSRGNSGDSWESWGRGSDTASFGTSSAHTADDGIFDTHVRSRNHDRTHSNFHQPRYSTSPRRFDNVDRRQSFRTTRADDYPRVAPPRGTDPYTESSFANQPLPHRSNTTQGFANPFTPATPRLQRANTQQYGYPEMHQPEYSYQQQANYLPDRSVEVDELANAVLERLKMDNQHHAPLRRQSVRRDAGILDEDEWDVRYPPARRGGYGGVYGR
ncbi:hypothetical protein FB567DRAFT_87405 [Paraphoma chrysanthemicola]|uniref:Uncharacterized protein n=1 Tax=Paraphoma chrysanthemicola TaxID=798071 RepID=A0A8K0VW37_9PLEO|nr:hypothetical protein FB567DRAFT_87405 [Paraphoma chrysanthemicola]